MTTEKKVSKKKKTPKIDITELEGGSILAGWSSIDECASNLWSGIHCQLLDGILVFGYKSASEKNDLQQLVVIRNVRSDIVERYGERTYAYGIVKKGWTSLNPLCDHEFLSDIITKDLEDAPIEVQEAWNNIKTKL